MSVPPPRLVLFGSLTAARVFRAIQRGMNDVTPVEFCPRVGKMDRRFRGKLLEEPVSRWWIQGDLSGDSTRCIVNEATVKYHLMEDCGHDDAYNCR